MFLEKGHIVLKSCVTSKEYTWLLERYILRKQNHLKNVSKFSIFVSKAVERPKGRDAVQAVYEELIF